MGKRSHKDYFKHVPYNKDAFRKAYVAEFTGVVKFNVPSIPDLIFYLEMMERDSTITDIRWMAYMLATAFIESAETQRITRTTKNGRGHRITRKVKVWRNFKPIEEGGHGKGRRYGGPVKVKVLDDGGVRVTEWDGNQWLVSPAGTLKELHKNQKLGVTPGLPADSRYEKDDGDELDYFGRGYVQLTWWTNYLATGLLLGLGLDLLLDPLSARMSETAHPPKFNEQGEPGFDHDCISDTLRHRGHRGDRKGQTTVVHRRVQTEDRQRGRGLQGVG
jgi:hypothetical protein